MGPHSVRLLLPRKTTSPGNPLYIAACSVSNAVGEKSGRLDAMVLDGSSEGRRYSAKTRRLCTHSDTIALHVGWKAHDTMHPSHERTKCTTRQQLRPVLSFSRKRNLETVAPFNSWRRRQKSITINVDVYKMVGRDVESLAQVVDCTVVGNNCPWGRCLTPMKRYWRWGTCRDGLCS